MRIAKDGTSLLLLQRDTVGRAYKEKLVLDKTLLIMIGQP